MRALVRQRTGELREATFRAHGEVPADRLESLARLARLAELEDSILPPPAPPRRWTPGWLFALTLVVVSVLLFVRVGRTDIELYVTGSQVSFVLPFAQVLTGVLPLAELGVSGLTAIELPRAREADAETLVAAAGDDLALRLVVDEDGGVAGTVTLAELRLPAGARVTMRPTAVSGRYHLTLENVRSLRADVTGPVRVVAAAAPPQLLDFRRSPKPVLLETQGASVDLFLTPLNSARSSVSVQLSTSDLAFVRIEEYAGAERSIVRRVSTVLSGRLYFESLDGRERQVRSGEGLRFAESEGEIRSLELTEEGIVVHFHGRVRGMTTGSSENRRSLMPTYLDWLRARHGLSVLWGTSLYLFGLIAGVLRWWKEV